MKNNNSIPTQPQPKPETLSQPDPEEDTCPLCEQLFEKLQPSSRYHAEIDAALKEWDDDPYQRRIEGFLLACDFSDQGRTGIALEIFRQLADHDDGNESDYVNLAFALESAGQPELALETVNCLAKHVPHQIEAVELGLRILRGQGRSWREYPWYRVPDVVEMNDALFDRLIEFLAEAGAAGFLELRFELLERRALDFSEAELEAALDNDCRFVNLAEPGMAIWALAEH